MLQTLFFDFFAQFFFGMVFFAGIFGAGLLILKLFKIETTNFFLEASLAFFTSLTLFTTLSVSLLFLLPDKRATLAVFTVVYFLFSFGIFVWRLWTAGGRTFLPHLKKHWGAYVVLILLVFSFFLAIYKTSILDEWLHRPVVKFFLENGMFPLKNPFNPAHALTTTYHYGTQIIGAAIALVFRTGVSESLDVMKIGFFAAAYLLFFGLLFEWSRTRWYALAGAAFLLLCGGSFFIFDNFSTSHVRFWGEYIGRPFNYPLSYSMAGITWVNIPLTAAFAVFLQKFFLGKGKGFSFWPYLFLAPLIVGFFLISELFGILTIGFVFFLTIWNFFQKDIPKKNIIFAFSFLLIFLAGLFFTGGVVGNFFKDGSRLNGVATLRSVSNWGYPNDHNKTVIFSQSLVQYLKDFLLEILALVILAVGLARKKISFAGQPLFFLAVPICLVAPFVISTSMGNLNLFKLAAFGILALHILLLFYFSVNRRGWIFAIVAILFVFGSVPVLLADFNIQFGKSSLARHIRCAENDLCYDPAQAGLLKVFERSFPGVKRICVAADDREIVADLTNSFVVGCPKDFGVEALKNNRIEYIFDTSKLKKKMSDEQRALLENYEAVGQSGKTKILKVY